MKKPRRKFSAAFKAKVAMAALRERKTLSELASEYQLAPAQISTWKKTLQESAFALFEGAEARKSIAKEVSAEQAKLHQLIGQQQVELDFLKKSLQRLDR